MLDNKKYLPDRKLPITPAVNVYLAASAKIMPMTFRRSLFIIMSFLYYRRIVEDPVTVEDCTHRLLGREKEDGFDAYKIELEPKPEAAVVWDHIIEWIRVGDHVPLKAEYYNERDELIRTMFFTDIKKLGGRTIPATFELMEAKKPGRSTLMVLEDVVFDKPIPKSVFTKQNLRRAR